MLPPSPPRWQEHSARNICKPEVLGQRVGRGESQIQAYPQEASKIPEGSVQIFFFHPLGLCLNIASSRKWACVPDPSQTKRRCPVTQWILVCLTPYRVSHLAVRSLSGYLWLLLSLAHSRYPTYVFMEFKNMKRQYDFN